MRYQLEQYKDPEQGRGGTGASCDDLAGPFCFEKHLTKKKTVKEFVYTEDGLDRAYDWLCQIYDERIEEWTEARDNPYKGIVLVGRSSLRAQAESLLSQNQAST